MKNTTLLLAFAASFALISFTSKNDASPVKTGKYGACGISQDQVSLVLSADNTFVYTDVSDAKNKKEISGTWTIDGKKIKLKSEVDDKKYHSTWQIDGQTDCLKSRNGLAWYRLCNCE